MKLVRYGAIGQEKPGLIDKSGQLRDLSAHVKDLDGEAYAPASLAKLAGLDTAKLPAVSGKPRIGAPVTGISKFVAIGLNYVDHAKETGNPIPAEPIFFLKANTALSAARTTRSRSRAARPSSTGKSKSPPSSAPAPNTSPRPTRSITSPATASATTCPSAISRSSVWANGPRASRTTPSARSARGWSPRTRSPDVQKLSMWLDVNGKRRQTGSTSTMIFTMAKCISYVSQFLTLLPGDIVTTGTPPGVGTGMKPPKFLNVGDVVTLGIEGLGEQRQEIVAA